MCALCVSLGSAENNRPNNGVLKMSSSQVPRALAQSLAALCIVIISSNLGRAQNTLASVDLSAVEATDPIPAGSVPPIGIFYSAANPTAAPLPGNFFCLPCWDLSAEIGPANYLVDDLPDDLGRMDALRMSPDDGPPVPGGYGPVGNVYPWSATSPGMLRDPETDAYFSVSKRYQIGFPNVINGASLTKMIHDSPEIYDLFNHNCVNVVIQAGAAAGVSLPNDTGPMDYCNPEWFGYGIQGHW